MKYTNPVLNFPAEHNTVVKMVPELCNTEAGKTQTPLSYYTLAAKLT